MKSPLRVECHLFPLAKYLKPGDKAKRICRWQCVAPIKVAQFRSRRSPNRYYILHPSTRSPGKWQLTWFDEIGPAGHVEGKTCNEALRELSMSTKDVRLEHVVDASGRQLAGARRTLGNAPRPPRLGPAKLRLFGGRNSYQRAMHYLNRHDPRQRGMIYRADPHDPQYIEMPDGDFVQAEWVVTFPAVPRTIDGARRRSR